MIKGVLALIEIATYGIISGWGLVLTVRLWRDGMALSAAIAFILTILMIIVVILRYSYKMFKRKEEGK